MLQACYEQATTKLQASYVDTVFETTPLDRAKFKFEHLKGMLPATAKITSPSIIEGYA